MEAGVDPEQAAFINQRALYDLNTQQDPENYPELDVLLESQDCHFLQDDASEIAGNDSSSQMSLSQGLDAGLPDCISAFYGPSHLSSTKQSQPGSIFPGSSRRESSQSQSKLTGVGMATMGSIGEGGQSIKNYIRSRPDLTNISDRALAGHLRSDRLADAGFASNSARTSKTKSKAGKGQAPLVTSKKKQDFDNAKDKIMAHLDLTTDLTGATGGKLWKNLDAAHTTKERLGAARAAAVRSKGGKGAAADTVPTLQ